MNDAIPSPDKANDSTTPYLANPGLRARRKVRAEVCELPRQAARSGATAPIIAVAAWRPSSDSRTDALLGFCDLQLCHLLILDLRLIRHAVAFALSWPRRKPMGLEHLQQIMRPWPGLDGRAGRGTGALSRRDDGGAARMSESTLHDRRLHPIPHDGSCGDRVSPPCGSTALSRYRAAERLPILVVVCHECGVAWRPTEPVWCARGRRTAA